MRRRRPRLRWADPARCNRRAPRRSRCPTTPRAAQAICCWSARGHLRLLWISMSRSAAHLPDPERAIPTRNEGRSLTRASLLLSVSGRCTADVQRHRSVCETTRFVGGNDRPVSGNDSDVSPFGFGIRWTMPRKARGSRALRVPLALRLIVCPRWRPGAQVSRSGSEPESTSMSGPASARGQPHSFAMHQTRLI